MIASASALQPASPILLESSLILTTFFSVQGALAQTKVILLDSNNIGDDGLTALSSALAEAPMACLLFGVTSHSQIHTQHDTHFAIILDATGLALVATWLACCSLGAACKCILDRLFGPITGWVAIQNWLVLEGRQGPHGESL